MSTNFIVTSKDNPRKFYDVASKGDTIKYQFDFTPWQDDNDTITSVTWTLESGQATISNQVLTAGVATALVAFSQDGRSVISVTATTQTTVKKTYLCIRSRDEAFDFTEDGYELTR